MSTWGSTYVLVVVHVLEHVCAVVYDGLQDVVVVTGAASHLVQLGLESGQEQPVMCGNTDEVPLAPLQLLLDVGSCVKRNKTIEYYTREYLQLT